MNWVTLNSSLPTSAVIDYKLYVIDTPDTLYEEYFLGDEEAITHLAEVMCSSYVPDTRGRVYTDNELLYTYIVPNPGDVYDNDSRSE